MFQWVHSNRGTLAACGLAVLASAPVHSDPGAPALGASDPARASGEVSGRVEIGRNRGVAGAAVLLTAEDRPGRLALTATDGHGAFRFDGLDDGRYRLDVRRPGFADVTKEGIVVRRPYRAIVDLTLSRDGAASPHPPPAGSTGAGGRGPARLRGRVRSEEGAVPTEIPIQLRPVGAAGEPRTLRTDEHGEFDSGELADGPWELQIRGVGWLSVRAELILDGPVELGIRLVRQPLDYEPSPLELMPSEVPLPPVEGSTASDGDVISSRRAR